MSKESFVRTKPHVNVGTIGHIDHGKTTLTTAILKVQSDKGLAQFKSYRTLPRAALFATRPRRLPSLSPTLNTKLPPATTRT